MKILRSIFKVKLDSQRGFSLVELAISITVIGLIVALVVKGGEMIENAKVSSSVLQIESYLAGIEGFRETYHAWPGDYDAAEDYIKGCDGTTTTTCYDGDGNGAIGSALLTTSLAVSTLSWRETLQSWRHLYLSGFGAGLPGGASPSFGSILPAASLGGGFELYYLITPPTGAESSHYFRYTGEVSSTNLTSGQGAYGFAAQALDRKMDDGNPQAGRLFSANIGTNTCVTAGGDYNDAQLDLQNCLVFIRVDG